MIKHNKILYPTLNNLTDEVLVVKNWYYETFETNFDMPFHTHPQIEIMYCNKGCYKFLYKSDINSAEYEEINVYENMFLVVNTGSFHKIEIITNMTTIYNIEFEPTSKAKFFSCASNDISKRFIISVDELFSLNKNLEAMKKKEKIYYIFNDNNNVVTTLKNLISELSKPQNIDTSLVIQILTIKLFIEISNCDIHNQNSITGISYIKKATYFMQQNFMNNPQIQEIAAFAEISQSYLQALFKKELGENIHSALTKIKLKHAKYLIETSNLNNDKIAKICGLSSRGQLINIFKKYEKKTPKEYKKSLEIKKTRHFSSDGEIELI